MPHKGVTIEPSGNVHVIPVFDGEPEHNQSPDCWCDPEIHYVDPVSGNMVYSHRRPH